MTGKLKRSIAILDVGHGNSAVLICNGGVVVIDTGPKNALLEYLREQNVTHIDVVLISHADQDHLGALAQLIASRKISVGRIALNSDADKGSDTWDDVLYEMDRAAWRNELRFDISLVPEEAPIFDQGGVSVEVLGPSRYLAGKGPGGKDRMGRKITTNSISAIIGLTVVSGRILLLPGDVDEVGLDDLLAHHGAVEASILVYPHHGGKPGAARIVQYVEKICKAVVPEVIVFSIGRGLHGTPNREVVRAIREKLPEARIMCTQLSEHCSDDLADVDKHYLNDVFCAGREHGQCCAGTILIDLDEAGAVLPCEEGHRAYICSSVKQPLCIKKSD